MDPQGLPQLSMAVNLSPRQFLDPNLGRLDSTGARGDGMPPNLLELEITESVMLHDIETAIRKLMAIRSLGVRLAVDDFGTGYSSLSQLKRFPIRRLEDRPVVHQGHPDDKDDMAITKRSWPSARRSV
jgi:EAL domain-containing protein (putative c-di-GMP-specific phosphodiesterase class I)